MTQAFNLSQLANNLNSAGQLDATDGLVNAVPITNGGTGASTAEAARTNLNVPTRTGGDASGTWGINISGNAETATTATTATSATTATTAANGGVTSVNGATGAVTISTTPTTAQVLNALSATNHQDVGSMTIAWNTSTTGVSSNNTIAGSNLRFTNASTSSDRFPADIFSVASSSNTIFPTANTTALTGTWKNMGGFCRGRWDTFDANDNSISFWYPSLWLRTA